ncbi:hypothetical protein NC653_039106 [Populus alba x Populus x berolinensis]|uniref:Uncharacterized protein n=1 Tax=Populus alba x Populus x berolinensis TaxID=444605 RepID=A0AAD6LAE9_9ROSI|nr:hypothetical protein NC653_039106 [Populus alba x Populus x berolinensis]
MQLSRSAPSRCADNPLLFLYLVDRVLSIDSCAPKTIFWSKNKLAPSTMEAHEGYILVSLAALTQMFSSSDSGFCRSHGVVLEQIVSYPTNYCECLVIIDRITCI